MGINHVEELSQISNSWSNDYAAQSRMPFTMHLWPGPAPAARVNNNKRKARSQLAFMAQGQVAFLLFMLQQVTPQCPLSSREVTVHNPVSAPLPRNAWANRNLAMLRSRDLASNTGYLPAPCSTNGSACAELRLPRPWGRKPAATCPSRWAWKA